MDVQAKGRKDEDRFQEASVGVLEKRMALGKRGK